MHQVPGRYGLDSNGIG